MELMTVTKFAPRYRMPSKCIVLILCSTVSVSVNAQQKKFEAPPPPTPYLEFFTPIDRSYAATSVCGASRAEMQWYYDGKSVVVVSFAFGTDTLKHASGTDIAELNKLIGFVKGNAIVRIDCNVGGVAITFSEYRGVRKQDRKYITIHWIGDEFKWVHRYGEAHQTK